jgi:hypothetical protein
MLRRLAKVTYLLTLALMIVAYALSAGKAASPEPQHEQPVEYWNI